MKKKKFKLPNLHEIMSSIRENAFRFPLALLFACFGSSVLIFHSYVTSFVDYSDLANYELPFKIGIFALLGFPLFSALALLAERLKLSNLKAIILKLSVFLIFAVYFMITPNNFEPEFHKIFFIITFIFAVLAILILPFIVEIFSKKQKVSEISLWKFIETLLLRILYTFVITGLPYLGILIAFALIDFLFDFSLDEERLFEIWLLFLGFIASNVFLSGIPKDLDKLEENVYYPKFYKILSQFILIPLFSLYFLILYVYAFKVVLTNNWPEGEVGIMVVIFSFLGVFINILLYPLLKEGHNWVKLFQRIFYIAVIPLVFLLFWAMQIRVKEYGLTEARLIVIIAGVWLLAIAIYYLVSRKKKLKIIFYSLFIVMFLIFYLPFINVFEMAKLNQKLRLKEVLVRNNLLVQGKIKKLEESKQISKEDQVKISGIIDYFYDLYGFSALQPWFDEELSRGKIYSFYDRKNNLGKSDILGYMGLEYLSVYERRSLTLTKEEKENRKISYNFSRFSERVKSRFLEIKDFDFYQTFNLKNIGCIDCYSYNKEVNNQSIINDKYILSFDPQTSKLKIFENQIDTQNGNLILEIKFANFLEELKTKDGKDSYPLENYIHEPLEPEELKLEKENDQLKVMIYFDRIKFTEKENKKSDFDFNGDLYLKEK
jgi:hypothetical protein